MSFRVESSGGHASAVWASRPTARSEHAFSHLIDADLDTALSADILFGRGDPTDPLVARQWRDIGPEALGSGIQLDRFSEISW